MKMTVSKRYLVLPVSYQAVEKRLLFRGEEGLVWDLTARLDGLAPDTVQYVDMGRFLGKTLEVEIQPGIQVTLTWADRPDDAGLYGERYRPAAHFSAARGWINDPNGLVKVGDTYHMFFQHNPAGRDWGNMHWGHAVSRDLFHWQQRENALFPDETGTMFSGSGIRDVDNRTGLKKGEQDPILLYYTAAGGTSRLSRGQRFTQCLAYSTDGGQTFQKHPGNPLIPHVTGENRDPKVVYDGEAGCYRLALYLEEDRFALYTSRDLLHWTLGQELRLPGDDECPDLYPLTLPGSGERYWVFSGAHDRYMVGRFDSQGQFQPVQAVKRLHYGANSYAAQTFSGVEQGRILRMAWNTSQIPASPFNCAMCTPLEMTLRPFGGEMWLCALPVREIEGLYAGHWESKGRVEAGDTLSCPLTGQAQDIRLTLSADKPLSLSLLGLDMKVIPGQNILKVKDCTLPLYPRGDGTLHLRMITDVHAVEIYADRGQSFLCLGHVADYNLGRLDIQAGGAALDRAEVTIDTLAGIWGRG